MGFPLRFLTEHWLCLGNHSCAQTCKHKWREHDELGTNFFQDREKRKRMLEGQTKLKPSPQLYPEAWGWSSWEHPWGVQFQGAWSRGALGALCSWHRFCSSCLSSLTSPGFSVWCKFSGYRSWRLPGSWTGWFSNYLQSYTPHDWKTSHKILITVLSWAGTFITYYGNGSADKTHYLWSLKLSSICGKILFAFSVAGIPPKG